MESAEDTHDAQVWRASKKACSAKWGVRFQKGGSWRKHVDTGAYRCSLRVLWVPLSVMAFNKQHVSPGTTKTSDVPTLSRAGIPFKRKKPWVEPNEGRKKDEVRTKIVGQQVWKWYRPAFLQWSPCNACLSLRLRGAAWDLYGWKDDRSHRDRDDSFLSVKFIHPSSQHEDIWWDMQILEEIYMVISMCDTPSIVRSGHERMKPNPDDSVNPTIRRERIMPALSMK